MPTALAVLYSGPLATAFAFWASQMIVQALGPLTTGIGYLGAPVVGVIAGIIVLGEVITLLDLVGVLVTCGGIVVVLLLATAGPAAVTMRQNRPVRRSAARRRRAARVCSHESRWDPPADGDDVSDPAPACAVGT